MTLDLLSNKNSTVSITIYLRQGLRLDDSHRQVLLAYLVSFQPRTSDYLARLLYWPTTKGESGE